jgi:hypothetical protein
MGLRRRITDGANQPIVQMSTVDGASTLLVKKMAIWCLKKCRVQGGLRVQVGLQVQDGAVGMGKRMDRARAREAQRDGEVQMISISRRVLRLLRRRRRPKLLGGSPVQKKKLLTLDWNIILRSLNSSQIGYAKKSSLFGENGWIGEDIWFTTSLSSLFTKSIQGRMKIIKLKSKIIV